MGSQFGKKKTHTEETFDASFVPCKRVVDLPRIQQVFCFLCMYRGSAQVASVIKGPLFSVIK